MTGSLRVAVSPCPNDTFIFGAWALGLIPPLPGATCAFVRRDVEELNAITEQARPAAQVVKISAAKAVALGDDWRVLRSGAAFGFGAGPKLVVPAAGRIAPARTIAVPGLRTTAATILRGAMARGELPGLAAPDAVLTPVRYDLIVGEVLAGRYDAGLLIHETALVVDRLGLEVVFDLGRYWDALVPGVPLPLGVIVAHSGIGPELAQAVERHIRASLKLAMSTPEAVAPLVAALAQEIDPAVTRAHIEAYVGDLSLDMGQAGQDALEALARLAQATASRFGA